MNKIKFQELTPDVYYKQSRDFQFIGRLFETTLNSAKTNTELLKGLPLSDNSDESLIDLMALTLGFKLRHHYNVKQLTSLCHAFSIAIRNKGNITSILMAIQALLNAEGIKEESSYSIAGQKLILFIPESLSDITLLKDLLDYILPAGMSCEIVREFGLSAVATTEATTKSNVVPYGNNNTPWTVTSGYNSTSILPEITNTTGQIHAENTAGLLMNGEINRVDEPTEGDE